MARKIYSNLNERLSIKQDSELAESWTEIESLSQLRTMVGGRFATVKSHWIAAGFPLRAHRGDRSKLGKVDKAGWLELTVWLDQQGFSSRIVENRQPVCFEIRPKETS